MRSHFDGPYLAGYYPIVDVVPKSALPAAAQRAAEAVLEEIRANEFVLILEGTTDLEELRRLDAAGAREEMLTARVQYGKCQGLIRVWTLNVRDCGAPMNPAGHEFYFLNGGTYLGFIES